MSIPIPKGYTLPDEGSKNVIPRRNKVKAEVDTSHTNPKHKITQREISDIMKDTLHPKHLVDPNVVEFIKLYLMTRDLHQCARALNIKFNQAAALLNRIDIFACIGAITQQAVLKYGLDPHEVVEKVKEIMRFDPIDLENQDGSFRMSMNEIPDHARRAIKKLKVKNLFQTDPNGVKVLSGYVVEYEFYDKLKAAELLGTEVNLFKKTMKVEHDITKNMSVTLLEAKRRGEERIHNNDNIRDIIDITPESDIE